MQDDETHRNQSKRKHGKSLSGINTRGPNSKPEYVDYVLKITFVPTSAGEVITHEDSSNFPVVVSDGYCPNTGIATANVTIKGVAYTFPKDFDYSYTVHSERNEVTGNGFEMIKETLCFKNLPGHPTLIGWTAEKDSSFILSPQMDITHLEVFGSFQLTGTGVFKKVNGSGIGMMGASTSYVVYHVAWIKGWPL